ncbi:MAG TPA: alpha/beta fold hydrolase [candidate division Zixibacteria bacterium]|nr:alpha/beta fold hydrolase [candidate division Zixibacteria bacterium]
MPFSPSYDVPDERRAYTMHAGPVGCLILHGFMGSPISTRPMATYLMEQGVTVHCPLLPGHGEYPDKFYKIPKEAWIDEVEEALAYLRTQCQEIFLIGHSMGTILGAHLVVKNGGFQGQIMLAPVYDVPDRRIRLLRAARYVMPWFYPLKSRSLRDLVYERIRDFNPAIDFDDPEVQAKLPMLTRVPTSGMDEMRQMLDVGQDLWPQLDLPILVFQGELDIAASPENTQKIFDMLPSEDKELILFKDAGHELMRPFEPVHAEVWPKTLQFITSHSALVETITPLEKPVTAD